MANTPSFFLQIVDKDGHIVTMPGGGRLEANLIEACTAAIVSKGVGFFKTEAQVKLAISKGLQEAISNLKRQTIQVA